MIVNFFVFGVIQVFAHNAMLDVDYDNCVSSVENDGIDEMWYVLNKNSSCYHLSNDEKTIKYYFADTSSNGYSWTTDVTSSVAEEIKTAYANSMKKWNDVYFYSYNSYGTVVKCKLIDVVEGTATDHNLTIYPGTSTNQIASTRAVGTYDTVETGDVTHKHYSEWEMTVNVNNFYVNNSTTVNSVAFVKERTGAHEIGHVLGLKDVDADNICNSGETTQHHYELLMGYGYYLLNRACNITYKDIAGVAITRGFHTDDNHKWLNCGLQSDGTYKLLCSVCNGVKNVTSLTGYTYETYGSCNNNHSLSGGNMMAVASYGTKDYYKCEYCRYVAPFSSIVSQSYNKTYHNSELHKCVNTVDGLEYTFYEKHTVVDNECTGCGEHIHSYTSRYVWQSEGLHKAYCSCGAYTTQNHVVMQNSIGTDGYGICRFCRGRVFIGVALSLPRGLAHTDNGSFILTNGTIVLVDEDINAYMAGTLEFYYGEKE